MAKPWLIIQNVTREGPGLLAGVLAARHIPFHLVDLSTGAAFPPLAGYGALVVLGGPDSANDPTPKMLAELARIREALQRRLPYLGICLGMQALVKASGGQVIRNPIPEIGGRDAAGAAFAVELTSAGRADPLFAGLPDRLEVFQLHGETVVLPPGAQLLGTGSSCRNQVVKIGPCAYGSQGHWELTPEMFTAWLNGDPDLRRLDPSRRQVEFAVHLPRYQAIGSRLFENFVALASSAERCWRAA